MNRTVSSHQSAIDSVAALADRYQISAIQPLLESCRAATSRSYLTIAILGRFKAGKSSFINHLIGRDLLPIGVVPVTSVVTDVAYGPADEVEIHFSDGHRLQATVADITSYVTEAQNPENVKRVLSVSVHVPELSRWQSIHFVDTPGLESAFIHNTEVSLGWAPNVDIALVAIGVDPPLSQQDVELIRKLLTYTPQIAVLLTKIDVLSRAEQGEVLDFVRGQLTRKFSCAIPVYPYSTRVGYEDLRAEIEQGLIASATADLGEQRKAIISQKSATLLRECEDYVRLTLRSAEMLDSERLSLRRQISAEQDALADTKLEIQLIARHAAGMTRQVVEKVLTPHEREIREEILRAFDRASSIFPMRLAKMLKFFGEWLAATLSSKLIALSQAKQDEFVRPLTDLQRQYRRLLQSFRDRLSERTMSLYGVPLRTNEPEMVPEPPKMPDVKIGHFFDHNWELISPILPMWLLKKAIFRRFRGKIGDETFKNLSRLTTQWDDIINSTIFQLQVEAERRVGDLMATVEKLTSATRAEAPRIAEDLKKLEAQIGMTGAVPSSMRR